LKKNKKKKKGKINKKKRKKKKGKGKSKKKKIIMDYCYNPQYFVCGGIVNPPHNLVY
jgi:hypothetical protein